MPEPSYILAAVLVAAGVTWLLRALPFALLKPLRQSEILGYLGQRMPVGIMVILAAYTLTDVEPTRLTSIGPTVVALGVTVGLHLWRRNPLVSLFGGTAVYTLMASVIHAM